MEKQEMGRKWNEDRIDIHRFNEKGLAVLERVYVDLPSHDESDQSILALPIVAMGITAFLAHTGLDSFRSTITGFGFNKGLGLQVYFDVYYNHCLKFLRQNDRSSTSFEFKWKTEMQLAMDHLENEKAILSEPPLFYSEFYETQKSVVDNIREAADYYLKWVHDNQIKKKSQKDRQEVDNGNIFQPKINEDITDELYKILNVYFEPEDQFENFLKGNQINGKINFKGNQNQLTGIFIDLKATGDIALGTHKQTFDFIKDTFLIKGKPIMTKQIFTYLSKPDKVNKSKFIDISI